MRIFAAVVLSLFLIYSVSSYGGVRSPDEEIQFRTAESLAFAQSSHVFHDLDAWPGFGVAQGLDGKQYSIFGPLEPVVLSVWLRLTDPLTPLVLRLGASRIPPSHYQEFPSGSAQADLQQTADARRFLGSFFQSFVTALGVGVFFLLALSLSTSQAGALFAALCYGLATPLWAYSGMYFGETYALLFLNLALLFLVKRRDVLSAICCGLAVAAHISVLLWMPFLFLLILFENHSESSFGQRARRLLNFSGGFLVSLAPLAWFNADRFGSIFETGRRLGSDAARQFGYGEFIFPDQSLVGLLVGPGKGLFVFVPVVVCALLCWRPLHRASPWLSKILLAAVFFRVLFIAARSDWHGGFCVGPRYLLLALPALLLPLAFWYREGSARTVLASVLMAGFIFQQAYLSSVEIFSFYRSSVAALDFQGIDAFAADTLYLLWGVSPLKGGWEFGPASWLLVGSGMTVLESSLLFGVFGTLLALLLLGRWKQHVVSKG